MSKKIVCHNCNAVLPDESVFCPKCGERVRTEENPSEPVQKENTVILQADSDFLKSGTILHAKYRVNGVIGQGGFGITYDGTDLNLDMHVAIKEYFPNLMANRCVSVSTEVLCNSGSADLYEKGMDNFLKEAKNMAKYAGEENFVTVHDYFKENNTAYIIMEFVEGITLKQYMKDRGKLEMDEVMPIIVPIMGALEKIHDKGMIHRDVSPSNIMVLPDGRVRLLDFGAVQEVSPQTQNLTTMSAVYKFGYSPIEQQTMGLRQGPFTDIYALCATIYEMLTESVPPSALTRSVEGDNLVPPSELGVKISPEQERVLLKGLAVNGSDRVQSIAELRDGLCGMDIVSGAAVVNGKGNTGSSGTGVPATKEDGGNKKIVLIVIAAVVLFGAALAALLLKKPSGSGETAANTEVHETISENTVSENTVSENTVEQSDASEMPEQTETQEMALQEETSGDSGEYIEESPVKDARIPDDAALIGENYYRIYHFDDIDTWQKAQQYCVNQGGHLAVITSQELNDALYELCRTQGFKTAFFGYSDAGSEGDWLWVTRAQPAYRNWGVSEPNSDNRDEDYALFSTTERNGKWNDSPFGYETSAFICQWGDAGIENAVLEIKIPDDAFVYEGHSYYLFDNGMESWAEAEQYCKSLGGYMAVINNSDENETLYNYMRERKYIAAFFGYSDKEYEGTWEWYGNDRSTFEDWGVNVRGVPEPNQDAINSDYAEFLYDLSDGHWNDAVFGANTHAYICEWDTVQQ